ncbi:MAG: 3-deoxy-D-manno-octulosonic acid transferase [Chitinophagaceae bacterium]|nr:MAG: 3-deoxy-D-manno-octulosonic acid transferase [Chitinophagaceae bacterium]
MSLFVYNLFILLYSFGARIISPWNPKAKLWLQGRKGLFNKLAQQIRDRAGFSTPDSPLVWIHCASLGEFEQGRPVIEGLKNEYPSLRVLITFFSPSGYEIRKNYSGADFICYLPVDTRQNAKKFLDLVKPDLVLWVKYEYWFYFLHEIKKRDIPLLLVSGLFRKDQAFFKWYGKLHRRMLSFFQHLFVQGQSSANLLKTVGQIAPVTVNGDTRFDRVTTIANSFAPIPEIAAFCETYPVIVAGSTWQEDEEELDHYANTHPGLRFIIAPHEIDEAHLRSTETLFKHTVRFSKWKKAYSNSTIITSAKPPNVLIIDNIGMLSKLYHYATITYVGGGFGNDGIHNILEAAVYGKPVFFGPVFDKFSEAIDLLECGGAYTVENALELEKTMNELLENQDEYRQACTAAFNYTSQNRGATQMILDYIKNNKLIEIPQNQKHS